MKQYAEAEAKLAQEEASQNLAIANAKGKYADKLADLTAQRNAAFELLQTYAQENKEEFGDKKTQPIGIGQVGFRQGPAKLVLMEGWDWDKVTEWVSDEYKRTKEEVDKKALLDAAQMNPEWGLEVGVKVEKDEKFFVKV